MLEVGGAGLQRLNWGLSLLGLPGGRNGQMDTLQSRDENDWLRVFRGD